MNQYIQPSSYSFHCLSVKIFKARHIFANKTCPPVPQMKASSMANIITTKEINMVEKIIRDKFQFESSAIKEKKFKKI